MKRIKSSRELKGNMLEALQSEIEALLEQLGLVASSAHLAIDDKGHIKAWVYGNNRGDRDFIGRGKTVEEALDDLLVELDMARDDRAPGPMSA